MKANLILLLFALGIASASLMAQPSGTFIAAGDMSTARTGHTATLLTNGKVLIAGGRVFVSGRSSIGSAELYDPSTGEFAATGNMNSERYGHTATLLPDGKVLIAGGWQMPAGSIGSAEIYDPVTGAFTPTGSMRTPRSNHTAVLLRDGRVLIAGGWTSLDPVMAAETYDSSTGTFTATGNTTADWFEETGVLLADGSALVGPDVYDSAAKNFTYHAGYVNDFVPATSLLLDGTVMVTGGGNSDPGESFATAELYDPSLGRFVATGNMTTCRFWHESTLLPDGTVLITGGDGRYCFTNPFATLGNAEVYEPSTKTFTAVGYMTSPRQEHTSTLLRDGRVLITGGFNYHGPTDALASADLYRPAVLVPAPLLYSLSGDGQGPGAILHGGTAQIASAANPASVGEALEIYLTGLTDRSVIPPQVSIGGRMAEVLWFGTTRGYAGLNQVNVRVPAGVAPGPAVPVRLNYIGRPSNEVTIGVR